MVSFKRKGYEIVIVAVVIVLSVSLGAGLYSARVNVQKSNLLTQELSMIRSSVALYKMMNHKNPESLKELTSETYEADSTRRAYLDRLPASPEGLFVDPFGKPYLYDSKSGWVRSGTANYERW